jgi:hypothetical protein
MSWRRVDMRRVIKHGNLYERRRTMNTKQARVTLTWLPAIALGLFVGLAPALGGEERPGGRVCSVASLHGSYGFYRTGKGAFGGPLAGQGIAFFDGAGNWSAVVNNSRDGEISLDEEFSGTYTIESNCTGKLLGDEDVELERFVIVDDGKGFYAVNVTEGITIYTVATRIHGGRGGDAR